MTNQIIIIRKEAMQVTCTASNNNEKNNNSYRNNYVITRTLIDRLASIHPPPSNANPSTRAPIYRPWLRCSFAVVLSPAFACISSIIVIKCRLSRASYLLLSHSNNSRIEEAFIFFSCDRSILCCCSEVLWYVC